MGRLKYILIFLIAGLSSQVSLAQTQYLKSDFKHLSGKQQLTTISDEGTLKVHSPKKAALLSLVPGLGQAYNKKYWKIPILYAGIGTVGYFISHNHKEYTQFRDTYINRLNEDTLAFDPYPLYSNEDVRLWKNYYWKKRDQMVLIMAGIYLINIIDATVDAHLFTFDVGDDLSMRIEPDIKIRNAFFPSESVGLKLSLKF